MPTGLEAEIESRADGKRKGFIWPLPQYVRGPTQWQADISQRHPGSGSTSAVIEAVIPARRKSTGVRVGGGAARDLVTGPRRIVA